jgi:hypothetical protein
VAFSAAAVGCIFPTAFFLMRAKRQHHLPEAVVVAVSTVIASADPRLQ